MNRRSMLVGSAAILLTPQFADAGDTAKATLALIKDPNCGCCGDHAQYLQDHGYVVNVSDSTDLAKLRAELGVPSNLAGCHVIRAEGYVIEGHVPAGAIDKLLAERPAIKGISVPGMPPGSPGMGGTRTGPLAVLTIESGPAQVFFSE